MPSSDPTNEHETSPTPSIESEYVLPSSDVVAMPDATPSVRVIDRAVAFRLEGQLYGLPIDVVREIQQLAELLPLPDDDPALVGLIELRGTVVPVLDLRILVGLPEVSYSLETPMVFCTAGTYQVCLIVDSVEDVVDLPPDGIRPPSTVYTLADRMLGTVRLEQGVLILLDIDRLVPSAALALADEQETGV
ncbi:MAG: chemotaxis protein CheW [Coriobacteriia bacterium]|nr:chemotaxis protein CheW [Coriobacteriia bacterium]